MIQVLDGGLSTTIQDLGRPGYYHVGIPLSGAADIEACTIANWLVRNEADAAVLEGTLLGPKLQFHADTAIAVTGADVEVKVNDTVHPMWEQLKIKKGDVVSFGYPKKGARIYIAVAGGIDAPLVLGSRSTYLAGGIGGLSGRRLKEGDSLSTVQQQGAPTAATHGAPAEQLRDGSSPTLLRVVSGLFSYRLTDRSLDAFYNDEWKVTNESDRMGYRFSGGRKIEFAPRPIPPFGAGSDPSNIVDAGYPYGSIQIPGGIEPIILHRDAVSGGGYATIGAVISADMDKIAQLQPNAKVRFQMVSMEEALEARKARKHRLDTLRDHIKRPV
ncbi:biotin-dependent carboxyltransferase family protein [Castellaniella sp.]|uniref:5-oxoprolinase subunit C family protein n=1 Tax=Castellaniella sp. TaxID=1955812 RepID=UPI00356A56F7